MTEQINVLSLKGNVLEKRYIFQSLYICFIQNYLVSILLLLFS